MGDRIEERFDVAFAAALAQREKQIQQSYRPIIGVHKWFARRPGTVFRNLLLSEFNGEERLSEAFWHSHSCHGIVADPFMGGGTTAYEANRLGLGFVGADINPIAYWIVRQSLSQLDHIVFRREATAAVEDVERRIGELYRTQCLSCNADAPVKYFLWVKTQDCPSCGTTNDLFPGYLLAEATRHPQNVVACSHCGVLNEYDDVPTKDRPRRCSGCKRSVFVDGPARRGKVNCRSCGTDFAYPPKDVRRPPKHRLWAIEYNCGKCRTDRSARMFKQPDARDLSRVKQAEKRFAVARTDLPIPNDEIPDGDETRRLHRWGYTRFSEMFNDRQLLGLGLLLKRLMEVRDARIRHALVTVFSDFLRYQNMLCRYDTYALKCQDIFSVHGFPVGLVQCENSLLGIPRVGSGSYRHFLEKFLRAKDYCDQPFETMVDKGGRKKLVPIEGERIEATFVSRVPQKTREVWLSASAANEVALPANSLDGVFTDPPYFDNVQYAELMDFCYAWLRVALGSEFRCFEPATTKAHAELTGNTTLERGLDTFTAGLSSIFTHYARALKPNAPFVFTYHHNDAEAYVPVVVAILDAGLDCASTIPVPAEMAASLHIARADSSVLDSVFVCRRQGAQRSDLSLRKRLSQDIRRLKAGGIKLREGDIRCLEAGHIARLAINQLRGGWLRELALDKKMAIAREAIEGIGDRQSARSRTRHMEQGRRNVASV